MFIPSELFCVLGPSIGYNREVLLFCLTEEGDEKKWILPPRELAMTFLGQFIGIDIAPQDRLDFGARDAGTSSSSVTLPLRACLLSKKQYVGVIAGMHRQNVLLMRFREYRELIRKDSGLDWHSLGALMYVFHNLDK